MTEPERRRLARILGMLGSEHEGERQNAALQAEAFRKRHGMTWEQMLSLTPNEAQRPAWAPPEPPPQSDVYADDEIRRRQWQAEIRAKAEAERHQWKERARHAAEATAKPEPEPEPPPPTPRQPKVYLFVHPLIMEKCRRAFSVAVIGCFVSVWPAFLIYCLIRAVE